MIRNTNRRSGRRQAFSSVNELVSKAQEREVRAKELQVAKAAKQEI